MSAAILIAHTTIDHEFGDFDSTAGLGFLGVTVIIQLKLASMPSNSVDYP